MKEPEQLNTQLIKINLPGGIVSPGDLLDILTIAEKAGVENVRFGNRQQLLFWVNQPQLEDFEDSLLVADVNYEINDDKYPNIISSYVTEEIFNPSNWLREGVYKDILNGFNHQPQLKINIVDCTQNLIPFFTGHLNYISSETSNFWYLYIRFPKSNIMYRWPTLVYTEDISIISKSLEDKILGNPDVYYQQEEINGEQLYLQINQENKFVTQEYQNPLVHTDFQLPYYEGLNKYGDHKFWLGIYRRREEFSISFLKEICDICAKTRLGQLYTTAWKSIIIKNIHADDRIYWSQLLNKYRVNVRHAANELNWQIEDLCDEAVNLKTNLVKCFEEADLRTYRLCFAIKTKPNTGLFGSVIIRKRNQTNQSGKHLYELLHTKNFNPNNKEYIIFNKSCTEEQLSESLIALTEHYYSLQNNLTLPSLNPEKTNEKKENWLNVYQCKHCETIYDDTFGDDFNEVAVGVKFETIEKYLCPTCEAPKEDYILKKLKTN
ncbi:rubredoxin domain-containing protein [Pedobacter cryophilus]|uniref:Rubredoxin n=1 Tax=Pedobacter cryophilus TaxID=2571271 RepID=A0A4V5P0F7_9SPHI|nr:rubredoxin domain-containing protein [Pedobacter cryophilus]TKB97597.1 rubredoxin [Pedobacter cryophilus]